MTVFFLTAWFLVGRDPRRGLTVPLFFPPDGLSAPAARYLRRMGFDDKRLPELVFRWRARNWPQTLNPQEQARWEQLRVAFLIEGEGAF